MIINTNIINAIFNSLPACPPEIGGILGGQDGVVSHWELDKGVSSGCGCYYSPDVEQLNATIRHWQIQKIEFLGLYHTHFFGVKTLSEGDIAYIKMIMDAMPSNISQLYFPLAVSPDREVIPFLARRSGKLIEITMDDLTII